MKYLLILRSLVLIGTFSTALVESRAVNSEASAVDYLYQYGYLERQDPRTGALRTEESFKNAIRDFQEFAGLNATGELDEATVKLMGSPRCGVVDKVGPGLLAKRRKRYTIQGSSWAPLSGPLTYKISKYSLDLTRAEIDDAVDRAFKVWSDVSRLEFVKKTSGNVDIEIKFVRRNHNDGNPFDGPGRVLAHAFFPQFGGDAHFDDDESFTVQTSRGVNLFQVAAHEFGHSLGLSHSQVRSALMAPFYRGFQSDFQLDADDVSGIQVLYGAPRRQRTTTVASRSSGTTTENSRPRPPPSNLCRDPKIDAITKTKSGQTYVFKGLNYYRLNSAGVDFGYPRPIRSDWDGVTGPVDAVFTAKSGNTYVFKGSQYWKFSDLQVFPDYPREISVGFPGVPSNLDGAFIWSGNGQPYFVKGNQYWRYSTRGNNPGVALGYPRPLANWRNLPSSIDSVFQWENDRTYFFNGENYYRFNDRQFRVDVGYPRSTAEWWFGCSGVKNSQPIGQSPKTTIHEKQNHDNQYVGPVVVDSKDDTPSIWSSVQIDSSTNSAQYFSSSSSIMTYIVTAGLLRLLL